MNAPPSLLKTSSLEKSSTDRSLELWPQNCQYAQVGDSAVQGEDAGFIKFGSRVDVFLPAGTAVNVALDQVVRGGETIIAEK